MIKGERGRSPCCRCHRLRATSAAPKIIPSLPPLLTPLPVSPPHLRFSRCRLSDAAVSPAPTRRRRCCPGSTAAVPKPGPLRPLPLPLIWLSHLSCLPLSPLVLPLPPSLPPPYHHRRRCCCLSASVIAVALVPPPITKQDPLRVAIHCILPNLRLDRKSVVS